MKTNKKGLKVNGVLLTGVTCFSAAQGQHDIEIGTFSGHFGRRLPAFASTLAAPLFERFAELVEAGDDSISANDFNIFVNSQTYGQWRESQSFGKNISKEYLSRLAAKLGYTHDLCLC